ncbi:MAG: tRNA (adenosine(37)-N6)-dimethylallyltransferase MiaA [Nitrospinae bacterium]|nr:tRNA (adenosine(37)-N6)-dimethylallyltransferase MiaA [Nitrospinota bacterium]
MVNTNIKTVIITGPTAVGKTEVAIGLALRLEIDIISSDSLQVYKKLNIGTSKPTEKELKKVHHHCIDIVEPDEEFNASFFAEISEKLEEKNRRKGNITLLCGGTGLFIDAFLNDYSCSIPSNKNVREKYNQLAKEKGVEKLYEELKKIDAVYAERITLKDRQKIVRAMEVYEITGNRFSFYHGQKSSRNNNETLYVVLHQGRKELYERINQRVEKMMEAGFIDEVKSLIKSGYNRELKPLKSIGYNELIAHYFGEISLDEAIEKIKTNSRRLAKRQLTWHRRRSDAVYIDIDEIKNPVEHILGLIQ